MYRFSNDMILKISIGKRNNSVASYYHTLVPEKRRTEIENTQLNQSLHHDMLTSFITTNTPRDINMYITHLISKNSFTILGFEFIVYHLGHHPEVVQRLRQEFDEVLEKNVTKPITHNDIDKLQYCDAVIKEVSRHFPVNYSLDRVNVEKDTIGGYVCSIMKRKDYWTDPEKFVSDGF
ncbi:cytochrome P450 [Rhizophagus irregularis DAOM 181602=DAOM 197198]|nr:cytochrome P450 [Rhizophagus irregularis DAOM 181602=DAOM 197198]